MSRSFLLSALCKPCIEPEQVFWVEGETSSKNQEQSPVSCGSTLQDNHQLGRLRTQRVLKHLVASHVTLGKKVSAKAPKIFFLLSAKKLFFAVNRAEKVRGAPFNLKCLCWPSGRAHKTHKNSQKKTKSASFLFQTLRLCCRLYTDGEIIDRC